MENTRQKSQKIIFQYGIALGIISIIVSLIQYILKDHLEPKPIYGGISFLLMIGAIVMGILNFKKSNEEAISFGEAVKIGVGISLISAIIAIIYNQLFIQFIEPDFMNQLLAKQEETMYANGMSEAEIEMGMKMAEKFKGPFISSAFGLVASAFFGFVIAAITGAIVKKTA